MEVLATGLADLGLLRSRSTRHCPTPGSSTGAGWSAGSAITWDWTFRTVPGWQRSRISVTALETGMVLTVEPGLYFHANDLSVPPEFRGIGVRNEDDVLITQAGSEVLSEALPITVEGLSEWTERQRPGSARNGPGTVVIA